MLTLDSFPTLLFLKLLVAMYFDIIASTLYVCGPHSTQTLLTVLTATYASTSQSLTKLHAAASVTLIRCPLSTLLQRE
jgi:hypothetical protein